MPYVNRCGTCGCDTCTIFSDDFTTDQLATNYDVRSGTFSVSGGELSTSTASGALLVADTAGTSGTGRVSVQVKSTANDNNVARLIGAYVDDNNYVFTELQFGVYNPLFGGGFFGPLVILYKREAGVNTEIGRFTSPLIAAGAYVTISLCWTGLSATTKLSNSGFNIFDVYTGTGNKCGVGADVGGGTVTFNDLLFSTNYESNSECAGCAATCECENLDNSILDHVVVTLSGIVDGTDSRDELNGTYILDFYERVTYGANHSRCKYRYTFPPEVDYADYLEWIHDGFTPSFAGVFLIQPSPMTGAVWNLWKTTCDTRTDVDTIGLGDGQPEWVGSSAEVSYPFTSP